MEKEKMKDIQLVVLMGGNATRLAPLTYALPKGLLSLNNMPCIYRMLYDFVRQGLNDITLVVSPSNYSIVKSFIEKAFENVNVNFVVQNNPKGPLHAFQMALPFIDKPTLLLLGDTSCETELDFNQSWLGYMEIGDKSHPRWCLIETDNNNMVTRQIDKPKYIPNTNKVLVGIYFFKNPDLLKEALKEEYELKHKEYQLSSAIDYYAETEKFFAYKINNWQDSGALSTYTDTIKQIKSDGYNFNVGNFLKITKTTKNKDDTQVLKNQYDWLKCVEQTHADAIVPRVFKQVDNGYEMEYLDYTTVFEYFNFYPMVSSSLSHIFNQIVNALTFLHQTQPCKSSPTLRQNANEFYVIKTQEALDKLIDSIDNFNLIEINGERINKIMDIFKANKANFAKLENSAKFGIVHNNLHFSNIFYLPKISGVKFISPKGFDGNIIGDTRLDFATLKLNYAYKLEQITNNLFTISQTGKNTYNLQWFCQDLPTFEFDEIIKQTVPINQLDFLAFILAIQQIEKLTTKQRLAILYMIIKNFKHLEDEKL